MMKGMQSGFALNKLNGQVHAADAGANGLSAWMAYLLTPVNVCCLHLVRMHLASYGARYSLCFVNTRIYPSLGTVTCESSASSNACSDVSVCYM
eukprot:6173387-Pleurochrysis_carterae.AAC.1